MHPVLRPLGQAFATLAAALHLLSPQIFCVSKVFSFHALCTQKNPGLVLLLVFYSPGFSAREAMLFRRVGTAQELYLNKTSFIFNFVSNLFFEYWLCARNYVGRKYKGEWDQSHFLEVILLRDREPWIGDSIN